MERELDSHEENQTWYKIKIGQVPKGKTILGSKWVYTYKTEIGKEAFKARLVVQGFRQKEGIDYDADLLYAPVAQYRTIRIVLAKLAALQWYMHTMDIKTAFRNGINPILSYMRFPKHYKVRFSENPRTHEVSVVFGSGL